MSDHNPDHYHIEPPSQRPPGLTGAASKIDVSDAPEPPPAASAPIELELEPQPIKTPDRTAESPARSSVKDLDVCPSCGASMRGADALVCVRCGFDLKTNRMVGTVMGETTLASDGQDVEAGPALVQPGRGDLWLPTTMAAISGLLLLICYLAGTRGLFPHFDPSVEGATGEINLTTRFVGLLKFLVLIAMWSGCGVGALWFVAHLLGQRFLSNPSDLKLAAVRMLGVVATMRLAALINLGSPTWEWTAEALVQLAIFPGLSIVLFRLAPRDGLTLTGAAVIMFMLLWVGATIVMWATWV